MRHNIKKIILDTALNRFNKDSWSTVSLRGVAREIGISDGNLRYHFPTKKQIVLNNLEELRQKFRQVLSLNDKSDIKNAFNSTFSAYELMFQYRFIFIESILLKKEYLEFEPAYHELREHRQNYYSKLISDLRKQEVLVDRFDSRQYDRLLEQIVLFSETWISYRLQAEGEDTSTYIDKSARTCLSLFVPYINEKFRLVI